MEIVFGIIVLVFSAIFHEVAHGFVADKLGDPTARLMGRLTLDPRKHIDPFLSLALPALLIITHSPIIFGGAKPVPVDPYNLREGRKDMALVSLAGPLTNVCLAVIASLLLKGTLLVSSVANPVLGVIIGYLYLFLLTVVHINILLAIFNLLPIPPLDGSKIFALLLPEREAQTFLSFDQIGMLVLFVLLLLPIGNFSLINLVDTIYTFIIHLLGVI